MEKDKNSIDVYKFRVYLKEDTLDEVIYTENGETNEKDLGEIYFTKEKIAELKERLIKQIQECENPFDVYCVDTDCYDKTLQLAQYGKIPELFKLPDGYVKSEDEDSWL